MTKIVMRKTGLGLVAVDEAGLAVLSRLKFGVEVMVDVKASRRTSQHRLFFALLNLLVSNTDQFPTVEAALSAVKIGLGEVDPIIDAATGRTVYALRSISFESCDQTRFSRLFEDAVTLIADRWLKVGHDELRDNVLAMVDGPQAASLGRRVA